MEEKLNNVDGQENLNNGGENRQQEGALTRMIKGARRSYIRFRMTKTGKVVIGGSKMALMGLGLWKAGELICGGKKEEPATVVVVAPVQPEQEEPVEEPAVEETNDEVEEAIQE